MKSAGNSDFPVLCPLPGCAICQAITTALLWLSQESTTWAAEQGQLNNTDKTRVPGKHPEAPGPGLSVHTYWRFCSSMNPSACAGTLVKPAPACTPPLELCGETEAHTVAEGHQGYPEVGGRCLSVSD